VRDSFVRSKASGVSNSVGSAGLAFRRMGQPFAVRWARGKWRRLLVVRVEGKLALPGGPRWAKYEETGI